MAVDRIHVSVSRCECLSSTFCLCVRMCPCSCHLSVVHVGWGVWPSQCILRCGPRLSFDFWTRKKRMCHIMINGQSEFSIHMKGERGGGYEPSDETNLFPLGRAWFKLNITFSVKLVWRLLPRPPSPPSAWFNSLVPCSFREDPSILPLCPSLFPGGRSSSSFVLFF